MTPFDAHRLLRRHDKPLAGLKRLCGEISAIREIYGPKVIEKRGKPVEDPRAFKRLLAIAETAKHFHVYMDTLKRPQLLGKALNARQVLMMLMVRDIGYSQAEVAAWFETNQPAVSRSIRAAESLHGDDIAAIRGRIGETLL